MRNTRKTPGSDPVVEQTRRLMDATWEGMFIHDSGVVLDGNRAAAQLFGRRVKELSRCRITDLVAEESRPMLAQQLSARPNFPCPITGVRKDGSSVPLEVTVKAVLTCNGRRLEVLAVSQPTAVIRAQHARN
jgi:PAS domain S-box-containing protein